MDADRLRELSRWAGALERNESADLRAAGRAIRTLCAENEELRRRLDALEGDDDRDGTPPVAGPSESRRPRRGRRRRVDRWRKAVVVLAAVVLAAGLLAIVAEAAAPEVEARGPVNGAVVGRAALAGLAVSADRASSDSWELDGRDVRPTVQGDRLVLSLAHLRDGEHVVSIRGRRRFFRETTRSFRFVVDTTAPHLRLARPAGARPGRPVLVRGTVEPGATLRVGGRTVVLDGKGAFVVREPAGTRSLVAAVADAAGNVSRWRIPVTVTPRRAPEPLRAVHVTSYAWADPTLRRGIMALIREGRINAVELDLKDEAGEVGWNADVPLARRMGSALGVFDLGKAVRELHARGIRVIGRLVCFRDPIHAAAAWRAGRRDEVVQTPSGGPYAGYGGFTNFASPAVRRYNIAIAVAAARLGVDDVLYDYVRRPDGPLSTMRFPGLRGTPERSIAAFLHETRIALARTNVLLGASVFGVAATRPTEVAQDIPAIAREVDYVAPMLYPSHWAPGEYRVADPNGEPYAIVRRSLADFRRKTTGTGARVVPWLQDFSLGRTYGPAEVQAQIAAARDAGVDEYLLWDAGVTYTAEALAPTAKRPALGVVTAPTADAPGPVRLRGATPISRPAPVRRTRSRPLAGLPPNELGSVPVVMHHMVRSDRVGDYDQTPQEFRAELELLWRRGYVPVRVSDLLERRIEIPKGTSPVVMTFDDSTRYQLAVRPDGTVKPDTAVGIMLAFARTHPGFEPAGTFYVNREPFGGVAEGAMLLRWLTRNGFELGNHTYDHLPLRTLSSSEVQRELVRGQDVIEHAVPGYRIRSLALPLGSMPEEASLAVAGRWHGRSYGPYGVLLVGANPAASPFSTDFDPAAIPRIRSSHQPWNGQADFAFAYWMRELARHPENRYVSDGDDRHISFPARESSRLAPRFRSRSIRLG